MNNNTELYNALRQKYPRFVYEAFHHEVVPEGLKVWFDFRMGDIEFHPTALVERRPFLDIGADIDTIVFNIGMIELISYWKCACPPVVEVRCGALTDSQMAFWRKLYWHGLGEFFYTNGIQETQEAFLQVFSVQCSVFSDASQGCANQLTTNHSTLNTDNYLVPIGGGKDSVVTLELLRRAGKQIRPLIMNPRGATVECARMAGFPIDEVLVIRRTIDPTLLELNAKGYLNGHTPFSAMLAFYTQLASVLSGVPNVALSNESSANESTVIGSDVNHQYSKSLEFEDDFRDYSSFLIPHSIILVSSGRSPSCRLPCYSAASRSIMTCSARATWAASRTSGAAIAPSVSLPTSYCRHSSSPQGSTGSLARRCSTTCRWSTNSSSCLARRPPSHLNA